MHHRRSVQRTTRVLIALVLNLALSSAYLAQDYKVVLKDGGRTVTGRFVSEDNPDYRRAALDYNRGLENKIAGWKRAIAELEAEPASPRRDAGIKSMQGLIRETEKELEQMKIQLGASDDTKAVRLRNRLKELSRAVDQEHRAYFEALHAKASPAELDARLKRFQQLQEELAEATEALSRHTAGR